MKFSYLYGAQGTPIKYSIEPYRDKTRYVLAAFLCCLMVFGITFSQFVGDHKPAVQALTDTTQVSAQADDNVPVPEQTIQVDKQKLAGAINDWARSSRGDYSISVVDQNGSVLAANGADKSFFMASIYKLYVAYIGYQRIDDGTYKLDDPYLKDRTRGKCLDEMIRNSDSPCAEKMMTELGKANIQAILKQYGLANTSMKGLTTSAGDVAIVLARLQKGVDLSTTSRQMLLDSMLNQKFRDGLPKGFSSMDVYDKVGFRDTHEYHDVGIVELPNGQAIIVSVLTNDKGVTKIADLARRISTVVQESAH